MREDGDVESECNVSTVIRTTTRLPDTPRNKKKNVTHES